MADLVRVKTAQNDPEAGIATALRELRAGRKSSHWIWYVFPQIAGLGQSPVAQRFAIKDAEEAKAYVRDPLLGDRLIEATEAVHAHLAKASPVRIETLMGSRIDALKLVSSMTLFARVGRKVQQQTGEPRHAHLADLAESVLAAARQQGFHSCRHTERALE